MTITTSFDSARLRYSIENMIFEWLTDALGSAVSKISANTIQNAEVEDLKKPVCQYSVNSPTSGSTGAGALKQEAVFKNVTIQIEFKTNEMNAKGEAALVDLDDTLDNYFRSLTVTKGRKDLGNNGLRRGRLVGPLDNNSKEYYSHRWVLTVRPLAVGT